MIRRTLATIFLGAVAVVSARAQCLDWRTPFGPPGIGGDSLGASEVRASVVFDDGSGPKLYFGGYFQTAGEVTGPNIARWNGSAFESLAGGFPSGVPMLKTLDDGTGLALYASVAGGASASVFRWNAGAWIPMPGLGGFAFDMAVFDDGTGPSIYALPTFGGFIRRWNGSTWVPLPSEMNYYGRSLAVFDDGSGPALYVGGLFSQAGGQPARALARWNGTSWNEVGGGIRTAQGGAANVFDLAVWNDGSGDKLYVAGDFASAGSSSIRNLAAWDGANWSIVGADVNAYVTVVEPVAFSSGARLAIGGGFTQIGAQGITHSALFDGATWSPLGNGVSSSTNASVFVNTFSAYDEGLGAKLFVGGKFDRADGIVANGIARFEDPTWSALGIAHGITGTVRALEAFDDGSGKELYVAGNLASAGDLAVRLIARWNGTQWSRVGSLAVDAGEVRALAAFDAGLGEQLFAAGTFTSIDGVVADRIASWNGATWSASANGGVTHNNPLTTASIDALQVFDDGSGSALFCAGKFTDAGGVPCANIARYDGVQWSALGAGFSGAVHALAVYDDGAGPKLYAGGDFSFSGATPTQRIARWNAGQWESLAGGGLGGTAATPVVRALAAFDDGTSSALYVGGSFTSAGGIPLYNLARWNGAWQGIGSALGYTNTHVDALRVFDDGLGAGPKLFIGGYFSAIGSTVGFSVLSTDGVTSAPAAIGGGVDEQVLALAAFDDGQGPALFAGGDFDITNLASAANIARYGRHGVAGCDPITGVAFCAGDGSASACPCGNTSLPGRGCDNSSSTGGAKLEGLGQANVSMDTLTLKVSGTKPSTSMLFFQGTSRQNGGAGSVFGDGLRCAGGAVLRLGIRSAQAGQASLGAANPGDPRVSSAGHVIGAATRHYQVWYRDVQSFCTSAAFNVSNGLTIRWAP